MPSSTAPNPPTLTATPLYDSSGGLLEIESQATEGVYLVVMKIVVGKYITSSGFKDEGLGMGIWGMWRSVISELKAHTCRYKQIHAKIVIQQ